MTGEKGAEMMSMVVESRQGKQDKQERTCYIVVKQAWSGLVRDACSYCDVTVPADAKCCPNCGGAIVNR